MPQVFRDAGYQAYAVGKLHVYPQRDRIGFDEVILQEEGRHHLGNVKDDFERFLEDEGYSGQELTHGMCNNEYDVRPWHLPERCHPTNWTAREMCRVIQRRDPSRPAFWYCSFIAPHPPVTPPAQYLELYRHVGVDEPFVGEWARNFDELPYALKHHADKFSAQRFSDIEMRLAREAFYAQCTYIDHQMRLVLGTLREEGLMDDTIIMLTGDHGEMLGNHNLWAKPPMFEWSVRVPMILVPTAEYARVGHHRVDDRFVELRDVMPTLLDLCDITIPETVEGISLVTSEKRDHVYSEHYEDERAMRMIRTDRWKLIWYPVGNRFHLFDLKHDPLEMVDLSGAAEQGDELANLKSLMLQHLYGTDMKWVEGEELAGEPDRGFERRPNRSLTAQRGWR
jgi:arylsulfatase A-like enzyme